ncbi:uncharacterized protein BDR25DRAFT_312162 [Lindgomyces ingoldianus]|uniref:Uncharacterized protein n=1 Tax=Lindgomyces ingoldianus TaxID=673940 RepID=A0ACB6R5F6_9PLEO|nr:uncharacterized protein BDR25DRAFT_312162 [Lindgomyces ingoldianus]KAF2474010.1 hypothetical protein BDR25DRAFT_312162 [Lindgomyces ingoldianus]
MLVSLGSAMLVSLGSAGYVGAITAVIKLNKAKRAACARAAALRPPPASPRPPPPAGLPLGALVESAIIPPLAVHAVNAVPLGTVACPFPLLLSSMRSALLQPMLQRTSRLCSSFS